MKPSLATFKMVDHLFHRFLRNERGNITIMFVFLTPVITAVAGASVVYTSSNSARNMYQVAVDRAVLAAVIPLSASNDQRSQLAQDTFNSNLTIYAKDVTRNPIFSISASPDNSPIVSAMLTTGVVNPFSGLIGGPTIPIKVSSTAMQNNSATVCLLTLNTTSQQTIYAYGNASFEATNCAVQANSNNGSGMQIDGNYATLKATQLAVAGGYKGSGYSPAPLTGVPPTVDPYASLPVPTPGTCVDVSKKFNAVFVHARSGYLLRGPQHRGERYCDAFAGNLHHAGRSVPSRLRRNGHRRQRPYRLRWARFLSLYEW
jgi:Flp pilus assembly protein TadG